MLKNYFKLYLRNILNNKLYTAINILGLSIGISASLLVYNYVDLHRSFDKSFEHSKSIYRVVTEAYVGQELAGTYGVTMQFLGPELRQFSDVIQVARMVSYETMIVFQGENRFYNAGVWGVDSTFLDLFGYKMIAGNRSTALNHPKTAVLSISMAKKIFGSVNVLGKTIKMGYGYHEPYSFLITGVVDNPPVNSHISFDILTSEVGPKSILSELTIFNGGDHSYFYPFFNTYVRLKENTNLEELEHKFALFLNVRIKSYMTKYGRRKIFLEPIEEIHLGPKYNWGIDTISGLRADESSKFAITWITIFALLLLLFSIFNFINLSLVNYIKRSKELVMRSILGSNLINFLAQFFFEALFLVTTAVVISSVFLFVFKDVYYHYLNMPADISIFNRFETYKYLFIIFLLVLFFKVVFLLIMVKMMKLFESTNRNRKDKEVYFSKYLVIFQYVVSFVLINLTIVIQQQLRYISFKDLGYTKDNILVVTKWAMGSGLKTLRKPYLEAFEHELSQHKYIKSVALSSITPGSYHHSNQNVWLQLDKKINSNTIYIDKNYTSLYGLKLLGGNNLTELNSDQVLINKTLMKSLGINNPVDIIGHPIYIDDAMSHHVKPGSNIVAGVLDDYYQEPLNKTITPVKYHYVDYNRGKYSIKFEGNHYDEVIKYTKEVFEKFYPGDFFNYTFLDNFINQQYRADVQFRDLISLTSFLSLVIASLGIWGLIIHTIKINRKGTAIRIVFGSSWVDIFFFFLKTYLLNFGLAIVFSLPITIFLVNQLLGNFAYRIEVNILYFVFPVLLILLLILLIIGYQVRKATYENPMKALQER